MGTALDVLFSLHDWSTRVASSPADGLALLARERVDLVVQDMNFTRDTTSGEEGVALFAEIRRRHPALPVILLTAWTHPRNRGRSGEIGRCRLSRQTVGRPPPRDHRGEPARAVGSPARSRAIKTRQQRANDLAERFDLRGIVFASAAMERLLTVACQVARADDAGVLVTGPNGAGKERIAEIIKPTAPRPTGRSCR